MKKFKITLLLAASLVALSATAQQAQITTALTKIQGPTPSPSPTPSESASVQPSVTPTVAPTTEPEVPTIDVGGNTDSGGTTTQPVVLPISNTKLPSIFAAPFVPHSGLSATLIPALLLAGVITALLGSLAQQKRGQ